MGRQLLYAFRYLGAHTHYPGEELSQGMLVYEQIGLAVGYMGVMMDVIAFARAVLVNATLEDRQRGSRDRPRLRGRIRWILWYPAFVLFAVSMIGTMNYAFLGADGRRHKRSRVFQALRQVYWRTNLFNLTLTRFFQILVRRPRARHYHRLCWRIAIRPSEIEAS